MTRLEYAQNKASRHSKWQYIGFMFISRCGCFTCKLKALEGKLFPKKSYILRQVAKPVFIPERELVTA